jgi:hypothetical protein
MNEAAGYTAEQIRQATDICRDGGLVPASIRALDEYTRRNESPRDNRDIGELQATLRSLRSIYNEGRVVQTEPAAKAVLSHAFALLLVESIARVYSIVTRKTLEQATVTQLDRVAGNTGLDLDQRIAMASVLFRDDMGTAVTNAFIASLTIDDDESTFINSMATLSDGYDSMSKKRTVAPAPRVDSDKKFKSTSSGTGSDRDAKDGDPVQPPERPDQTMNSPAPLIVPLIAPPPNAPVWSGGTKLDIVAEVIRAKVRGDAPESDVIASIVSLAHFVYRIDVSKCVGGERMPGDIQFDSVTVVFFLLYLPRVWAEHVTPSAEYPIQCAKSDVYLRGRLAREFYCAYVTLMAAQYHIDYPVPYETIEESAEDTEKRIAKAQYLASVSIGAGKEVSDGLMRSIQDDPFVDTERKRKEKVNAVHELNAPAHAVTWCRKQLVRLERHMLFVCNYFPISRRFLDDLFASARADVIRLTFSRYSATVSALTSSVDIRMQEAARVIGNSDLYSTAPAKAFSDEITLIGNMPLPRQTLAPLADIEKAMKYAEEEIKAIEKKTATTTRNPVIGYMMNHPRSTLGGILLAAKKPTVNIADGDDEDD